MDTSPSSLDNAVFKKTFECYYASLCVYARRYIQDLATREDIVQDVFCALWVNRYKIDYSVPIKNYLLTCVKNRCINYLRQNAKIDRNKSSDIEKTSPLEDGDHHLFSLRELESILSQILMDLPEEYRIAFEMSKMENVSTSYIADALKVSVRTVERYRKRVIDRLKTELNTFA